ncbi:metalloregulator ArsR/SmtB family transcription factor [Aestuariirhabdus sp. Z084]|uniref:ArsR/SmtB family transcription factor n=1 Tax=Aestuariirhabdus haliotis TaxID=2918751 RepID=UPI00201B430F|nr:metalloregulator ArsR/SmtB family transcription factor [Aestuariirhabdus haliotis]MCL6414124.1 metalloregulator ArsR/SmtB family transcription factor [Aestuariirhabdus haliotis]MCL6418056.1 metalloregulator ArsR/SmtB family transcription factor [Aestuariirhabdus haliotis]
MLDSKSAAILRSMLACPTKNDPSLDPFAPLAQLCKASSDPLRLQILRVLQSNSFGVLELCSIFDVKQSGMSHHLKVLANAGLVDTRREGNSIFYRRALTSPDQLGNELRAALFKSLDAVELSPQTRDQVQAIHLLRSQSSREFFARHAEQFRQQQELIADYSQYAGSARDLLLGDDLNEAATAIEIGPGEGAFLAELSPRFHQIYAIDNARPMLDQAQAFAQQANLNNIEFILGTTADALKGNLRVDAIVINMVLHHVASPAELIEDAATLLKPGGRLVITDLCSHDQNWVREACGDLWLGFEPEEFTGWAQRAGLVAGDSLYQGQRNGFQLQVRRFNKPAPLYQQQTA